MTFSNVITVIPTFFTETGSIDYESIHKHIKSQINNGIKDIVILGTTSEAPTLKQEERIELAKYVYYHFSSQVHIIAGLGGNNTMEMISEIQELCNWAHSIMISQPSYNKPSQEGIFQHFSQLISHTTKPIVIYNIPSRCGVNIEPQTIKRISSYSGYVVAVKEASGNLDQVCQVIELCPHLRVYSGDDVLTLPIMSVGGVGVISVVSNLIPQNVIKMTEEFEKGNLDFARDIFYKMKSLIKDCFVETNPVPVKFMLSILYQNPSISIVRLPLVQLSIETKNKLFTSVQMSVGLV